MTTESAGGGLALAVAAGGGAGLIFFGGLWLTLARVLRHGGGPASLLAASFGLRAAAALAILSAAGGASLPAWGGALAGFGLCRSALQLMAGRCAFRADSGSGRLHGTQP